MKVLSWGKHGASGFQKSLIVQRRAERRSELRRCLFESLEDRRVMASDWQNPWVPSDVNNDQSVTALDALTVINQLNRFGSGPLSAASGNPVESGYNDTTGDAYLSALDALLVINSLNMNAAGNQLASVVATSSQTAIVTFRTPVADSLLLPNVYHFTDASLTPLEVVKVSKGPSGNQVILTTQEQAGSSYAVGFASSVNVEVPEGSRLNGQGGLNSSDSGGAPRVVGLVSVNATTILASYDRPMGASALEASNYKIFSDTGQPLEVVRTRFAEGETVVQLETATRDETGYTVNIQNVGDRSGQLVNFEGRQLLAEDVPGSIVSVAAISPNKLVVVFNKTMADNALAPQGYVISYPTDKRLAVTEAHFDGTMGMVVVLTTEAQADIRYSLYASLATDLLNNLVSEQSVEFQGMASQPKLVGITSTGVNTIVATFSEPMSEDVLSPSTYRILSNDTDQAELRVRSAQFVGSDQRIVELVTATQTKARYKVLKVNATDAYGSSIDFDPNSVVAKFAGPATSGGNSVPVDEPPRVVGAAAVNNTTILVAFSEPMSASVLKTTNYVITQTNLNNEVGGVRVTRVDFDEADKRSVLLTTSSQSELLYTVTVVNVTDQTGTTLAGIDTSKTNFPGMPPSGSIVDSDLDGVSDSIETRGWTVTVALLDGTSVVRQVTSDLSLVDTDKDELLDADELRLGLDPRSADTDSDGLSDYAEAKELYSSPTRQDTDGDSLDDNVEFNFFKTSPFLADSDGDQIRDGFEILSNRNPRISDLPQPRMSVGQVDLTLDVRFDETSDRQQRNLETKVISVSSTKDTKTLNTTNFNHVQGINAKHTFGDEPSTELGGNLQFSTTHNWGTETNVQKAYENSLTTDKETTQGFNVQRSIQSAAMRVDISLENLSSLGFRVKNLQVTAFVVDPQNPSAVTPVATLLPDSEPAEGFTLGPFAKDKGPIQFSNTTIFPSLIESFLANPTGLLFQVSNYDIIDEQGRNFGFTNQEILERTTRLAIDFGGASDLIAQASGNTLGDTSETRDYNVYRIATSAGRVVDTNRSGTIDAQDRRVVFGANGKEVGITMADALAAIGLSRYDEDVTPSATLTPSQQKSSYSIRSRFVDIAGVRTKIDELYRLRNVENTQLKAWQIVNGSGIVADADFSSFVLKSGESLSVNYVTDLDGDGLPADLEAFYGTSDSPLPRGALVPDETDKINKQVKFESDPNWPTGTLIRVTSSGIDLQDDTNYYVRNQGGGKYSFHLSSTDAASNVFAKPLTAEVTSGLLAPFKSIRVDTVNKSVTFGPKLDTGAIVRVSATGGGLDAGSDYYIRNHDGTNYSFYTSFAAATDLTSKDGQVFLTNSISARILVEEPREVAYSVVTLNNVVTITDPSGPLVTNGEKIQLTAAAGGLSPGTNYYLSRYSFFGSLVGYRVHRTRAEALQGQNPIALTTTSGRLQRFVINSNSVGVAPASTDLNSQSFTFDPAFPTGSQVILTDNSIGLTRDKPYWVRNTNGTYSFYNSAYQATIGGTETKATLVDNVVGGIFSRTKLGTDSDNDGLDDHFETLVGWTVSTPLKFATVYSSPRRLDSNFDRPSIGVDSDRDNKKDRQEYDGSDLFAAPGGWDDKNTNGLRDEGEVFQLNSVDLVLDPIAQDTDTDGITDADEIIGFQYVKIADGQLMTAVTNPLTPYTDSDTFTDGLEQLLGLDPRNGNDSDDDGDGLPDLFERTVGWAVGKPLATKFQVTLLSTLTATSTFSLKLETDNKNLGLIEDNTGPLTRSITPIQLAETLKMFRGVRLEGGTVDVQKNATGFEITFGGGMTGKNTSRLSSTSTQIRIESTQIGRHQLEGVSTTKLEDGPLRTLQAFSSTKAVDTDDDGLTDYEEFFLHLDPAAPDTDGDGLDDRLEYGGYTLGHHVGDLEVGIIKTDPLDADTDNDKLSDGREAELTDVIENRWLIRQKGLEPYRAYSHPLLADADFDNLVDGDEYAFDINRGDLHSDPNKGNLDGDSRDDGQEFLVKTDPLVEDFLVTVYFTSLDITKDGDVGTNGDFGFDLGIRLPDVSSPSGYSTKLTSVMRSDVTLTAPFQATLNESGQVGAIEATLPACTSSRTSWCNNGNDRKDSWGIKIATDTDFKFGSLPNVNRSASFGVTADSFFAIEGVIVEADEPPNPVTYQNDTRVFLGGLEGVTASERGLNRRAIFGVDDLTKGIHELKFTFGKADNVSGKPSLSDDEKIEGSLSVIFVVS